MDPIKTIGKLLTGNEERDAIHIAIMPVQVGEDFLYAKQRVRLAYGSKNIVLSGEFNDEDTIGILDPFLTTSPRKGQWVWCFLLPNSVTGMRHHWTHSRIDDTTPRPFSEAELWLRAFADRWNFDYDEMISGAQEEGGNGFVTARGIDLHSRSELDPGDEAMFWQCMEALTNQKFDEEHRQNFTWSCGC